MGHGVYQQMDCTSNSLFFFFPIFFVSEILRWCVGCVCVTDWVHLAVLTHARTRVRACMCVMLHFLTNSTLCECVWECIVGTRVCVCVWVRARALVPCVHNVISYITYIYIDIYSIYITYTARTYTQAYVYMRAYHGGGILCACFTLVFFLLSLFLNYFSIPSLTCPLPVSCVTVPSDLDLTFSRLSLRCSFWSARNEREYYQQKCSRRTSPVVAQFAVALIKLPRRGKKSLYKTFYIYTFRDDYNGRDEYGYAS